MESEQLLKQRIKVIALWPFCTTHGKLTDQPKIGDIFEVSPDHSISNETIKILHVDKYPHLFSRLEWWQEREISDLPEYISVKGIVYKIDEWRNHFGIHPFCGSDNDADRTHNFFSIDWHFSKKDSLPATLAEYEAYTETVKQKV